VGLVQRIVEAAGIPTVGITLNRTVTARVRPPRAVFLRYPFGHPMGEPFAVAQQAAILEDLLRTLETAEPGAIVEPGYAWRRHRFA
jgi:D-proline reductase (dithiol) PrdB